MDIRQRRFKNILVDRRFQLKFSLFVMTAVACYLSLVLGIQRFLNSLYVGESVPNALVLAIVVFLLLVIGALSIYVTHKIAGPMHALKKGFQIVASGDRNYRVTFRPDDEFAEVAEEFNKMMDSLTK